MKRIALLLFLLAAVLAFCQPELLAPTPPMGWNSWDAYAQTIDEKQVRATAEWMSEHLKAYGWEYVVIDEGWYITNPQADPKEFTFSMDKEGRFQPDLMRYPSSRDARGMKPLADSIHALGLKFGIHILRGIPKEAVKSNTPIGGTRFHAGDAADTSDTCPWNAYNYGVKDNAAGQAYYDSLARLYAGWGVDFVKVDCIADHPYKADEIRMISTALRNSGRRIVLSLSPGPTSLDHAEEVARYAEMWRISNDFWDHWGVWPKHEWSQGLLAQFAEAARWSAHAVPGHWPDADMLPLGYLGPHAGEGEARSTQFTHDEQRTLMTLWCIFHSPLMMGGNLLHEDEWTTSLLTNAEVLAVDQHSHDSKPVISSQEAAVWTATPNDKPGKYIAVFNLSDHEKELRYNWQALGIEGDRPAIRDLWQRKDLLPAEQLEMTLAPHASVMLYVSAEK